MVQICRVAPKKVSAACFTADCKHITLADKFGEVYAAALPQDTLPAAEIQGKLQSVRLHP